MFLDFIDCGKEVNEIISYCLGILILYEVGIYYMKIEKKDVKIKLYLYWCLDVCYVYICNLLVYYYIINVILFSRLYCLGWLVIIYIGVIGWFLLFSKYIIFS